MLYENTVHQTNPKIPENPQNGRSGRGETTTPLQKLFLMNNSLVVKQAEALAARSENGTIDTGTSVVVEDVDGEGLLEEGSVPVRGAYAY